MRLEHRNVCKKYPHPCVRCGMCCLAQSCPMGILAGASPVKERCKFLSFKWDTAVCSLLEKEPHREEEFGIGTGCCIKASAVNQTTGFTVDFASLPGVFKIEIVRRLEGRLAQQEKPGPDLFRSPCCGKESTWEPGGWRRCPCGQRWKP